MVKKRKLKILVVPIEDFAVRDRRKNTSLCSNETLFHEIDVLMNAYFTFFIYAIAGKKSKFKNGFNKLTTEFLEYLFLKLVPPIRCICNIIWWAKNTRVITNLYARTSSPH